MRRGFYISHAKIALLLCTFGVMYFTYTPNEWILQWVPAWSFKVGFATLGIVHMTQYLAIVWRYDRRIAEQGRGRRDWFHWLHGRRTKWGIALAALAYVTICIAYGDVITSSYDNRWLMSALLVVGFTSTLMHYYFDGFIWRVRHQQNRDALGLGNVIESARSPESSTTLSWWRNAAQITAGTMLLRQLLYFGLPMATLTWGAVSVWQSGSHGYVGLMYQAQVLSQQGQAESATEAARAAYASMQRELPFAKKIAELKPTAAHEAQLAFLLYNESLYRNHIMPALAGANPTFEQQQTHLVQVRQAAELLLNAVNRGGDPAHPGREQLTAEQARQVALSWQAQVRQ